MSTKQRSGRSFLGTLFLLAVGFAAGFYHAEIFAFGQRTLQQVQGK